MDVVDKLLEMIENQCGRTGMYELYKKWYLDN